MTVKINPSKAVGKIIAPPSKSMAHRALICGALSEKSVIKNLAFSKDIEATLNCLKSLGAKVLVKDDVVEIGGLKADKVPDGAVLYCNESGSTLRFLLPLCMSFGKRITFTGEKRLFERPLGIYEEIAKEQNILFQKTENSVTVYGKLKPSNYRLAGDISSQFISGMVFALSTLKEKSIIEITGKFESASYVDLTVCCLEDFGIKVERSGNTLIIDGQSSFESCEYTVEGDCSNAAFLDAFNYIGGNVLVDGLNTDTLQGDRVYKDIFEGLKKGEKQFDLSDCPDLAPVCFALSSFFGGAVFTGTKRLKLKESDRAETMKRELLKFGIEVEISENLVEIKNGELRQPKATLYSHNDHRIAMALTLLLTLTGGSIESAEAVAKSYPDFYKQLSKLGIDLYETY